jgi:hypothetical protein
LIWIYRKQEKEFSIKKEEEEEKRKKKGGFSEIRKIQLIKKKS